MQLRKLAILFTVLVMSPAALNGQKVTFNLDIEARAEYLNSIVSGKVDTANSGFQGSMVFFKMFGDIGEHFSYFYRQRVNSLILDKRFFDSIDMLYLKWRYSKFEIMAGKLPIALGGFDIFSCPIDEYYFPDHSGRISPYLFGISGAFYPRPYQRLIFQCVQSPYARLDGRGTYLFAYNTSWYGRITPWWHTIYSADVFQVDNNNNYIEYFVLGNEFIIGKSVLWLDYTNRGLIASAVRYGKTALDCTVVMKYTRPITNLFEVVVKGTYDRNAGISFDALLPQGTNCGTIGGGLNYYPIKKRSIRVHAICYTAIVEEGTPCNRYKPNQVSVNIGLTWKVQCVKQRNAD